MGLTKPKPAVRSSDDIRTEITEREAVRAGAQEAFNKVMPQRLELLRTGTDAAHEAFDKEQAKLSRNVERQTVIIDDLRSELAALEAAAEQDRRRAAYDAAKQQADMAADTIRKTYPKLVRDMHGLLRVLALAQDAVAAANEDLPIGADPIADPEAVARGVAGQVREIESEEVIELWSRLDQDRPVDAEFQDSIHPAGNGWGRRVGDLQPAYRLRRFRQTKYREPVYYDMPTPLAATIRLPRLTGDRMAWGADRLVHDPAIFATGIGDHYPGNVLNRLAEIEADSAAKPASVARPVNVDFELLGDVVPLPEKPAIDTISRRPEARTNFGSSPYALPARTGGRR